MQGNTFFGFSGGGGSTPPPVSNSWLLNGNTEGAEKYFGTNDNFSIPIYTNGSAIGVFTNTGDFGFGTISPTSRVHIVGVDSTSSNYSLKIDNSAFSPLLYIQNDGYIGVGTASPNALMDIVAANATPFAFSIRNSTHTANTTFGYKIYQENSGYMTFYMDGAKYMSISPNGSVSYSKSSYTSPDTQLISQAFAAGNASYGFYCRGYLSNNGLSVDGDGNVGINQLTATAKLHIKGVDATSSNYALKIDNSVGNPLFYVKNSSRVIINGTSSDSPSGVDTAIFTSNLSGYTFQHAANITWLYDNNVKMFNAIGANYGTVGTFTAHDFSIRTNNVDRIFINSTGNVGVGTSTPTSKLHVKGIDATSSNYALKVDNSASSPLLYVRNDGYISVGSYGAMYSGNTLSSGELTLYGREKIFFDTTFANSATIGARQKGLYIDAHTGIPTGNFVTVYGVGLTGFASSFNTLDAGTGEYGFRSYMGLTATSGDANFSHRFVNGNVMIGADTLASAKLQIQGINTTSANYALKIDNSASSPLLYVRNDGVSTFNTSSTYATNFGYDVKWQAFSNPSSSNGNYISLCTGGGSIFQSTFSRINGGVVKSEMYFIESNDTTYMAIGVIGDANKALSLRTNDTDRLFISHNGDIGISKNAMSARLHVFGVDATNSINQRLQPVTNVTEDTTGNTVVTTDATANVTSQTIAVPADKVISLESTIVYRKTGGAGVGVTGDGTTIKLNSSVKNVGGTLTLDTVQNTYTGTTNAIAGVSATYTISGTNVLVSVTGVLNDNITWNVITKVNTVA